MARYAWRSGAPGGTGPAHRTERTASAQLRDAGRIHAQQVAEHLVGMFAEPRRGARCCPSVLGQPNRVARCPNGATVRQRYVDDHVACRKLRIGEHIVYRIHRRKRHLGGGERVGPQVTRPSLQQRPQTIVDLRATGEPANARAD